MKSLWLGEVQNDWSEEYVASLFAECGKRFKVKLMRDRTTGSSAGYGFLEFESHADAKEVLDNYADKPIPGTSLSYTLRWGGGHGRTQRTYAAQPSQPNGLAASAAAVSTESSIFVGDVDYAVTEAQLQEAFSTRYRTVVSTKLAIDLSTGLSRGFGFVKFSDVAERDRAMTEMNGHVVGSRPIRCSPPTTREEREQNALVKPPTFDTRGLLGVAAAPKATEEGENTCVFVGGLDESVTPDMLRHHFGLLGDIAYIRIPPGRGCGFVGFVHRKNAEAAISTLQGLRINGYKVRLSWGSMRQGPKRQTPALPGRAAPGRPGQPASILGALPVTQVKKEHKTPFGSLTNDYVDVLPEPRRPWEKPAPSASTAAAARKQENALHDELPAPRLTAAKTAIVPMSPYVAQLKARYEAYRSAAGIPPNARPNPDASAQRPEIDAEPGDRYSHYSTRTSRPAKRPLTLDEIHIENHLFANKFLLTNLPILASGVLLPMQPPLPLADHFGHYTDTPMAAYLNAEALQQAQQQQEQRHQPQS